MTVSDCDCRCHDDDGLLGLIVSVIAYGIEVSLLALIAWRVRR